MGYALSTGRGSKCPPRISGAGRVSHWSSSVARFEQRRIDAPEVDRPLEVAILQVAEQRRFADKTGLHARPGEEDRTGRAVVGAKRPILIGSAAELAKGHDDDPVGQFRCAQVVEERTDSAGKLAQ